MIKTSIGFSGPAWTGINTSWIFLGKLLAGKWYNILGDKEYASIIKWDNNNFFLYISDENFFISKYINYFFAWDNLAVEKNKKIYDLDNVYDISKCECKYKNTFAFGSALKLLGIDLDEWKKFLENEFTGDILNQNFIDIQKWYDWIEKSIINLTKNIDKPKQLMFGNEVVWKWAIKSWMDFYAAYPMTPASSLIDVIQNQITEDLKKWLQKIIFFQWEDEIAVSMAMLGAKFGGKRAMCGTSGWWFALMTESISFSNQAEIWWVYILSQRDGPSTWTPTFTWQGDLNYALNASFGDTFPIVLAPSTFQEWYNLIWKALNWSDIYQHPIIFLIDKQFSEWYLSVDTDSLIAEKVNGGKLLNKWQEWYKRYENADDGISPYVLPWTENGEFIASSYEHDEYGATNEDPEIKKMIQDKRWRKMDTFVKNEFNDNFRWYDIINPDAEEFYVTFGFNRYVLEDVLNSNVILSETKDINKKKLYSSAMPQNDKKKWLIVIKVLQPLDMRLKEFLDKFNERIKSLPTGQAGLTFVEMNYSWQLQELVTNKCLLNDAKREWKIKSFRKYTLYPIFAEEIIW